jgi:hypothetical protein
MKKVYLSSLSKELDRPKTTLRNWCTRNGLKVYTNNKSKVNGYISQLSANKIRQMSKDKHRVKGRNTSVMSERKKITIEIIVRGVNT